VIGVTGLFGKLLAESAQGDPRIGNTQSGTHGVFDGLQRILSRHRRQVEIPPVGVDAVGVRSEDSI
jgi:hypothetical protein